MGPPLVMTKLAVNSWNAIIICMTRLKSIIGVRRGKVILKNIPGFDIPSTVAASYNSFGICFNPARNITIDEPNCQTVRRLIVNRANFGLLSQPILGIPKNDKIAFSKPLSANRK